MGVGMRRELVWKCYVDLRWEHKVWKGGVDMGR